MSNVEDRILDLDSPDYAAARRRYLISLRERYNVTETHAFANLVSDEQVGSPKRPPLLGKGGVYIPLSFDMPTAGEMTEREMQPRSLPQVLGAPGHIAIIGDAGSGKTTVLHVIVSVLAAEDPAAVAPDLASILPTPCPIPIFLPLRLFEHACGQARYSRCVADLLRFLDDWFSRWCPSADLPAGFLSQHVRSGHAWLLLDALDEVPDPAHRETIRNVIQELGEQVHDTRLIVTARVTAYRSARLDNRFTVVTIRDLDEKQRTQMVHAIYNGLALPDADRRASDLVERLAHSKALRDLGRTPVMIWTAAVIHALRGELPYSRAALYDAYVDIMLKHSYKRTRYDVAARDELADGQGWPLPDRRHYLTYVAFEVHKMLEAQSARQPEPEADRHIVVSENELADQILARYFRHNLGQSPREARRRAREFLTLMVERSGLLYETEWGYTFGDHLTMQEFMAGCYLGEHYAWEDTPGYAKFLAEKVGNTWWREVFLLAAGFLAEKPGFAAPKFLQQIAGQGQRPEEQLTALTLAGRSLFQMRAQRRPTWYARLAQTFTDRLYQMLYAEPVDAPITARQEAGLVLGLLYGYPDDGDLLDPRFDGPQGLPGFVPIEEGWFWIGSTEEEVQRLIEETESDVFYQESPRHRIYLDAYEIARYPTTNSMFARFIEDGGYQDARWWAAAIADGYWREGQIRDSQNKRSKPEYWDDSRWNSPSQPVIGVTWYEATAYCRWLTAMLDDGCVYRLPTEAEWERAARGESFSVYPWGDEWQEDRCNSRETDLSVTSPVGIFPKGMTEDSIEDMAGNISEWCQDWYDKKSYAKNKNVSNPFGPAQGFYRVLRGGSWYDESLQTRCAYRNRSHPAFGNNRIGFRCVRTPIQTRFFALREDPSARAEDRRLRIHQFCEHFSKIVGAPLFDFQALLGNELFLGVLDLGSLFPDLPSVSADRFPILFVDNLRLYSENSNLVRQTLLARLGPTNKKVIFVFISDDHTLIEEMGLASERMKRAYAYDVICLSLGDLQQITASSEPRNSLRQSILSQMDLSGKLYKPSGPTPSNMFFGREGELKEICHHIKFTDYVLIGGRRIGKSSVLKQLERAHLTEAGFHAFYHECSFTPTQEELVQAVTTDRSWFPEPPVDTPSSLAEVIYILPDDKPSVILLDEADKLIESDQSAGYPIFNTLRALSSADRCRFVLCGERALRAERSNPDSPLNNFGSEMLIGRLERHAVIELVTKPMSRLGITLADESAIVQYIWEFTSGHPSVVQSLCEQLLKHLGQRGDHFLNLEDVETIVTDSRFLRKDFLDVYWERATVLERLCSLVMAADPDAHTLTRVREVLTSHGVEATLNQVDGALERLVDLRNILERTAKGYEFAVTAFPEVIAKTARLGDLIALNCETYRLYGDVQPSSKRGAT
jgi:formylglycine-generating enzyme required for sulfatase activity/Cdc6-like AAA superfamily ATPase